MPPLTYAQQHCSVILRASSFGRAYSIQHRLQHTSRFGVKAQSTTRRYDSTSTRCLEPANPCLRFRGLRVAHFSPTQENRAPFNSTLSTNPPPIALSIDDGRNERRLFVEFSIHFSRSARSKKEICRPTPPPPPPPAHPT